MKPFYEIWMLRDETHKQQTHAIDTYAPQTAEGKYVGMKTIHLANALSVRQPQHRNEWLDFNKLFDVFAFDRIDGLNESDENQCNHPQMQNTDRTNKNIVYTQLEFIIFTVRTVILGIVILKAPYLLIDDQVVYTYKTFTVFLNVISIFQFIFMFDVIERKNLFQFLFYIPLLIYSMAVTIILIAKTYGFPRYVKTRKLYISLGFLYAYLSILISEVFFHLFMYNRLKSDFKWSEFKKVGVNPVINGKLSNNFRSFQETRTVQCNQKILHNVLMCNHHQFQS